MAYGDCIFENSEYEHHSRVGGFGGACAEDSAEKSAEGNLLRALGVCRNQADLPLFHRKCAEPDTQRKDGSGRDFVCSGTGHRNRSESFW